MTHGETRHFSLIRSLHLSDLLTLGNGFAGVGALLALMGYIATSRAPLLWLAITLYPVSLVLDFFDGRVARARRKASAMGQELDSLADVISFGVGPAALGFAAGLRGGWDTLPILFFVGCAIARLARYNVTASALSDEQGKVRYYEGVPVTGGAVLVGVFAACAAAGRLGDALPLGAVTLGPATLHPLALGYLLLGCAMISKTLRVPKP